MDYGKKESANKIDLTPWLGIGQLPMAMIAMTMGGHVRVGLEDNIFYSRGVLAKTNAELVERIVRISKEFGREVATPDEARKLLSLTPP